MAWVSCQTKLSYKYRRRTHTVTPALEEAYLRVDISCGSEACDTCLVGIMPSPSPTSSTPAVPLSSLSATAPYYLLPDAAALSELLELFELPDISNYIILASAVKQVSLQSSRKAGRLRALYRDRRRRAVLLDDLHCLDTAGPAAGADPSLPAALASALYYAHHLGSRVPLLLLSDSLAAGAAAAGAAAAGAAAWGGVGAEATAAGAEAEATAGAQMHDVITSSAPTPAPTPPTSSSLATTTALCEHLCTAAAAGVTVLSAADYVGRCWPAGSAVAELFDSLAAAKAAAAAEGGAGGGGGEGCFRSHLTQQEVEQGLVAGELMRGVLHVSRRNPREAVVELGHGPDAALGRLVRVCGRGAMNRAMEGDAVAVRLLPPRATSTPPATTTTTTTAPTNADIDDEDDVALALEDGGVPNDPTATTSTATTAAAGDGGPGEEPDYSAELLAEAEGGGGGGEEGALAMLEAAAPGALPEVEVVAILHRDFKDIVACLSQRDEAGLRARQEQQGGGPAGGWGVLAPGRRAEALLCLPLDRRLPPVRVVTRQWGALCGSRFVVRVDNWERSSRYPRGHVLRVLGPLNDLAAESEAVLVQAGIVNKPFCEAALSELPHVPSPSLWRVPPEELTTRRDLTGSEYFVVSIDPVGCTDVDDAMHVRFLTPSSTTSTTPSSNSKTTSSTSTTTDRIEVGVHIADVSWFVRPHSMLDGEAAERCTSVYLVGRRLDMLPGLLSEGLASLLEGQQRLAVSVIWTLRRKRKGAEREGGRSEGRGGKGRGVEREGFGEEEEGGGGEWEYEVEDVWFGRTVICSRHQLHYQQAQDILDGRPPAPGDELPPPHTATLRGALTVLDELTAQLRFRRVAAGALELASAELRFKVDPDTGAPCGVAAKNKVPMMDVVAEMMIAANSAVAACIAAAYPQCALLRNHPPPRPQAYEQIRALLEPHTGGAPLDPTSNRALATALAAAAAATAAAAADPAAATLIRSLATRAMSEASYNSSGTTPPATPLSYHYGLALQYYTHFTSPIRRYADLVVHRQLLSALSGAPPPAPHPELAAAAATMNVRHRAAKSAQKSCAELYLLLLLHAAPHVDRALVCGISGDRLDLFVPTYQLRGAVSLTDRRGLPRLPLRPGEEEGGGEGREAVGDEEDAFTLAKRRLLSLTSTPTQATIIHTPTGTILWSTHLWQSVSVRLHATGHRAHGPKLTLRLLHPTHPDALQPPQTPTPLPTQPPMVTSAQPSSTANVPSAVAREAGTSTEASFAVVAGTASSAGSGGGTGGDSSLPPHLRLLLRAREQQQQQPSGAQLPSSGPGTGAIRAAEKQGTAPAAVPTQPLTQDISKSHALAPSPITAIPTTVSAAASRLAAAAVAAAAGVETAVLKPEIGELDGGDGDGGVGGGRVLSAPTEALTAAAALVVEMGPGAGRGPSGLGKGEVVSERVRLRRTARLEMRLAACRRGSVQEQRLRERLEQMRAVGA